MTIPSNRALVEAAAWRVHLSEADLQTTPQFEDWLAVDPDHRHAWAQVDSNWNIFRGHDTAPEILALRRAALADAHDVARQRWVENSDAAKVPGPRESAIRQTSRRWAYALAAAATVLISALAWYFATPEIYRTHVGERRLVALADGSRVELDSATELSVHFSSRERNVTLAHGQARFDVAHDAERPFIVAAGTKRVVATGTAFNVDMLGSRVLVTLIEGHVIVLPQGSSNIRQALAEFKQSRPDGAVAVMELTVGQELVAAADGSARIQQVDIDRATSWQKGQLLFDDEPLSTVVQRVNRYSSKPVVITDDSIRGLRISGVFDTNDIPGFLATITHYLPLNASTKQDAIELVRR